MFTTSTGAGFLPSTVLWLHYGLIFKYNPQIAPLNLAPFHSQQASGFQKKVPNFLIEIPLPWCTPKNSGAKAGHQQYDIPCFRLKNSPKASQPPSWNPWDSRLPHPTAMQNLPLVASAGEVAPTPLSTAWYRTLTAPLATAYTKRGGGSWSHYQNGGPKSVSVNFLM